MQHFYPHFLLVPLQDYNLVHFQDLAWNWLMPLLQASKDSLWVWKMGAKVGVKVGAGCWVLVAGSSVSLLPSSTPSGLLWQPQVLFVFALKSILDCPATNIHMCTRLFIYLSGYIYIYICIWIRIWYISGLTKGRLLLTLKFFHSSPRLFSSFFGFVFNFFRSKRVWFWGVFSAAQIFWNNKGTLNVKQNYNYEKKRLA